MQALRSLLLCSSLVVSGLLMGLSPAAGQAAAPGLPDTHGTVDSPLGPLPAGAHVDYAPTGAELDPLPPGPAGSWWAVPVLRERSGGGAAVPAWRVLQLDALGLTRDRLAANGLPTYSLAEMAAMDVSGLAGAAVPEGPLEGLLHPQQAQSSAAPAGASAAAMSSLSLPLAIAITSSASSSIGAINNAWVNTFNLYASEFGIPLYQAYVDVGTASISSVCDMQTLAARETDFTSHGIGLIIFDSSTLGFNGPFGVAIDGTSTNVLRKGESVNDCNGSLAKYTPAVMPSMYASTTLSGVTTYMEPGLNGLDYVTAHELGHFLAMDHIDGACWVDGSGNLQKTLETFTGASDTPSGCQTNWWPPWQHYNWYFNAGSGSGGDHLGGHWRIANEWSRLYSCLNNGYWCPSAATPSKVQNLQVAPGNGRATLTWQAPLHDGGTAVNDYLVFRGSANGFLDQNPIGSGGCASFDTAVTCTDTGLSNGQTYWYYVRASNAASGVDGTGWGPRSDYASVVPANRVPPAPASPSPTDGATGLGTAVTLSWGSSTDPDGDTVTYNVYASSAHPPAPVPGCQSIPDWNRQCSYAGLQQGVQYHWGVTACDSSNLCSALPDWHFTTQAPANNAPYTPSSPSPSNGATGVSTGTGLSWSGGDPDAGNTVTYTVYLNAGSGTPTTARCTNTSSTSCPNSSLGGLSAGTLYNWKVVATDNLGATSQSQWSFTTASANNAPYTPSSPSPSNGATGVSTGTGLSWSGGDPDVGNTVTYTVYLNAGSGTPTTARCTNTSLTSCPNSSLGGLSAGTLYTWKVVATDNLGATSQAQWSFTTAAANNAPYTPNSPSPANGATGVAQTTGLSWSGGDPDAGNTVTYTVYLNAGSGTPTTARCTNTSSTSCPNSSLGGLSAGTLYTWKVVATDNLGATNQAQWSFTTNNHAPDTPSNPSPANGATGVSTGTGLSWSGGDEDLGDTVTYTAYLNAGSGTPTTARCTNTSSLSCPNSSLGGLAAGTLYTWKVVATDNHGATSQAQWSFTTAPANNAPYTPSSPSPSNGATGVSTGTGLSWSGGDPDAGNTVTYTVYLNAGSGTPTTARCTNTSSTSCPNGNLGGLSAGTLYTWKVVATDNLGATSQAQWSFTTSSACTPNAPTSPTATAVSGQRGKITVTWTAPTNCQLSTFKVYRSTASGSDGSVVAAGGCNTATLTSTSTSCTDDNGLGDNTWYYYKVSAVSASSQGSLEGSKTSSQPSARTNGSPNYPSTPSGPSDGHTGTTYTYSTSSTDPDGNSLQYIFDWYDNSARCTSAWASSGSSASCSHSWNNEGQYCVSAYAQDTITPASPWSYCNWVYINYPGTPLHFQYLTDEGWTVGTSSGQDIAYGNTFGTWVIKTGVTSQFTCGNAYFGHDPSSGYQKKCYYQNPGSGGIPAGYTYCATEGGTCSLSGVHDIAFGNSHGTWAVKAGYSGSLSCTNGNFWDVDPGYQKTCYYR